MRFASYHPAINLLFFVAVIVAAAVFTNPVFAGLALACALASSIKFGGVRAARADAGIAVCAVVLAVAFVLFNHAGVTNLGRTPIGNEVTLESIACGLTCAARAAAVAMWLVALFAVFTTDKVVYLLGRVAPKASLMVAVTVRAVPVTAAHARDLNYARRGIGRGGAQGSVPERIAHWARRVTANVTWSIDRYTAMSDSMRSRGSSLHGRSAYARYRFDNRDRLLVEAFAVLGAVVVAGAILGQTFALFAPTVVLPPLSPLLGLAAIAYALFALLPAILEHVSAYRFSKTQQTPLP